MYQMNVYPRSQEFLHRTEKLFQELSPRVISGAKEEISESILRNKVGFADRPVAFSPQPLMCCREEIERIGIQTELIGQAINRILERFRAEAQSGADEKPLHDFYAPYREFYPLIAGERRRLADVQLARFDSVGFPCFPLKIVETNTLAPSTVNNCAMVLDSWLKTRIATGIQSYYLLEHYPVQTPWGFLRFLQNTAMRSAGSTRPRIAFVSCDPGVYGHELDTLALQYEEMRVAGEVESGSIVHCDMSEVSCDRNGVVFAKGEQVDFLYNKFVPRLVPWKNGRYQGWINASRSTRAEFLNSIGAMCLTDAKRTVALLQNRYLQQYLEFSSEQIAAIELSLAKTELLSNVAIQHSVQQRIAERVTSVLKPDNLFRGDGVVIGRNVSDREWAAALEQTAEQHGVIQEFCEISSLGLSDQEKQSDFFGLDLFLFGEKFAGVASRGHSQEVFNLGKGGYIVPTVTVGR